MVCIVLSIGAFQKLSEAFKTSFLTAGRSAHSDMAVAMLNALVAEIDSLWVLCETPIEGLGAKVVVDSQLLGADFVRRVDQLPDLVAPVAQQMTLAARQLSMSAENALKHYEGAQEVDEAGLQLECNKRIASALVWQATSLERLVETLPPLFIAARMCNIMLWMQAKT